MPRFFVDNEKIKDKIVTLDREDAHHISYSLRMAVGDSITVCDKDGREYLCKLCHMDGEAVTAEICEERDGAGEAPLFVHLFQAFPKGDKLELIIQKSVELGVFSVTPFESERCVKRPKAEKIDKQLTRMNKIAREAAKQCGRSRIPEICAPLSFDAMLERASACDMALFCYEDCHTDTIKQLLDEKGRNISSLAIIIGSEGGFSEREANEAKAKGAIPVTLGKRILRCETAPIFALSCISFFYEL